MTQVKALTKDLILIRQYGLTPVSKDKFLLYMLAGIFAFQAGVFAFGVHYCAKNGGIKECPEIGKQYQQTFNVMIATTLALLTGQAMKEK